VNADLDKVHAVSIYHWSEHAIVVKPIWLV